MAKMRTLDHHSPFSCRVPEFNQDPIPRYLEKPALKGAFVWVIVEVAYVLRNRNKRFLQNVLSFLIT